MFTPLSVELTLSHCGARTRCVALSWSEKAELRRLIDENCGLCAVSGTKRRSCTDTERTHRGSLEHTRKPDVGAAGGLCAGNRCAGNICAVQMHDNPHSNWLLRLVGLCSETTSAPQTAGAARDPRHTQPAAGPANSRCLGDMLFTADRDAIGMQSGGLHAARVPAGARLAIAYQMFWHL
jgi:hypothetical protein